MGVTTWLLLSMVVLAFLRVEADQQPSSDILFGPNIEDSYHSKSTSENSDPNELSNSGDPVTENNDYADLTLKDGSETKDELGIRMKPRTTNRKSPFRRKDLRRQRKKKLMEQYPSSFRSSKAITDTLQDAKLDSTLMIELPAENHVSSAKLSKDLTSNNVPPSESEIDDSSVLVTTLSSKQRRKGRRRRLKPFNRKRKNPFQPSPTTKKVNKEILSDGENTENEKKPVERTKILHASRRRKQVHAFSDDTLIEDKKSSPGGPRPPGMTRLKRRKIKRRKKQSQKTQDIKSNKNGDIQNVGSLGSSDFNIRSNLFRTTSPVAHNSHLQNKPTKKTNRKKSTKKRIRQSFDFSKIKKEPNTKANTDIQNRSHNSGSKNFAMSFQRVYNPRDNLGPQLSNAYVSPPLIQNSYSQPRNPPPISSKYPSTISNPQSGYGLPINRPSVSTEYSPPKNTPRPQHNHRFPANSRPMRPTFRPLPIATTPRGQFGSPPLGTPPPTFVRPLDSAFRNIKLPLRNSNMQAPNNFPPPVRHLPSLPNRPPILNIESSINSLGENFNSRPFPRIRSPMLSPNFRPSLRNIENVPQSFHHASLPFRSNVFSNNFRKSSISSAALINRKPNILPSSPVAIIHESRIFPGLDSPLNSQTFNHNSPLLRSEHVRAFNPHINAQRFPSQFNSVLAQPFIQNSNPTTQFPQSGQQFSNNPPSFTTNKVRHQESLPIITQPASGFAPPSTISENIHRFRDNLSDFPQPVTIRVNNKTPGTAGFSSHFQSTRNRIPDSESSLPHNPSYFFEPPPPKHSHSQTELVRKFRDSLTNNKSPEGPFPSISFATSPSPSVSSFTGPTFTFKTTPLPAANIDYSSHSANSLPVINTYHHLKLDKLVPPFKSIASVLTLRPRIQSFSTAATPEIFQITTETPNFRTTKVRESFSFTPQKLQQLRKPFIPKPLKLTSKKEHSLKPSSKFRSNIFNQITTSNPFNRGTTVKPIMVSPPSPSLFPSVSQWLESFQRTDLSNSVTPNPLSVTTRESFSTSLRPIKENSLIPSSITASAQQKDPRNSLSTSSLRIFQSTTPQPVFNGREAQIPLFNEQSTESLAPFSHLVSKPILPMDRLRGSFRQLIPHNAENTNSNENNRGIRPLTIQEQSFQPINSPFQRVRFRSIINTNSIASSEEQDDHSNVSNVRDDLKNSLEQLRRPLFPINSVQNLAPPFEQNIVVTNPMQLLSSPAPSSEFFNQQFLIQSLPTLPPSPHVPLTNTIRKEQLFSNNIPQNQAPSTLLTNGGNSFFRNSLRDNSLVEGKQEVLLLTSDENNPPVALSQSMLDVLDFSRFKGRSFIFMRTNNHEYSVIFPLSEPQRIASDLPQVIEALSSEEVPRFSFHLPNIVSLPLVSGKQEESSLKGRQTINDHLLAFNF